MVQETLVTQHKIWEERTWVEEQKIPAKPRCLDDFQPAPHKGRALRTPHSGWGTVRITLPCSQTTTLPNPRVTGQETLSERNSIRASRLRNQESKGDMKTKQTTNKWEARWPPASQPKTPSWPQQAMQALCWSHSRTPEGQGCCRWVGPCEHRGQAATPHPLFSQTPSYLWEKSLK